MTDSSNQIQTGVPKLDAPIINADGTVSIPWYRFWIALWNRTGGSSGSISAQLDTISNAVGSILYRGASVWTGLAAGVSGQVLQTQGAGNAPVWGNVVTLVDTGVGLTGGPIETTGTIQMAQMGAQTLKGNAGMATADPSDLSVATVQNMLAGIAPGGPAGGDLGGIYPDPAVEQVQGTAPTTLGLSLFSAVNVAAAQSDLALIPGTNVFTQRTITAGTNIAVTNGNGVSGNPTIAVTATASSFTPTWTAASSNPAIGNGTITGYSIQIGKLVFVTFWVVMGSTTTYGSGTWSFSLPTNAADSSVNTGAVYAFNSGVQFETGITLLEGANAMTMVSQGGGNYWSSAIPHTWKSGDRLVASLTYIAA